MTPPLTPKSSQEELELGPPGSQWQFHTYLRAFYPFHPTCDDNSSTVTLPLNQGDIILLHSVHTNGWADGTLLSSGARGWLPTNYCETYDYEPIRNLMKALTSIWDLLRGSGHGGMVVLNNPDFTRGLVAGVRILLERTNCLNRESAMVQSHHGLRRSRKVLLSELSGLVRMSRSVQRITNENENDIYRMLGQDVDDMILKAFKLVLCAIKFLDIWIEELSSTSMISYDGSEDAHVPPTPPTERKVSRSVEHSHLPTRTSDPVPHSSLTHDQNPTVHQEQAASRPRYSRSSQTQPLMGKSNSIRRMSRPSSFQTKRDSLSHRASLHVEAAGPPNPRLASAHLSLSHDTFLNCLGSFIGLHLHSRSSSELLVNTQQAVLACRSLLGVVELIWDRDPQKSELLWEARENLHGEIAELMQATQDVLQPARSGEDVFIPTQGKRLVGAATACIRGAGECVAKARFVIERIGDFDVESAGTDRLPVIATSVEHAAKPLESDEDAIATQQTTAPPPPTSKPPPPPPPIEMPSTPQSTDTMSSTSGFSSSLANDFHGPNATTTRFSRRSLLPPLPHFAGPLLLQEDFSPASQTSFSSTGSGASNSNGLSSRNESIDDSSLGSSSAYVGSMQDSETSAASSTSTRATSPDVLSSQPFGLMFSSHDSQPMLNEESEDLEVDLREKSFAHELVYSKTGQITGGTLPALIECLTTHDSTPDAIFVSTFYLTFRLFTTPCNFAQGLIDRFGYVSDSPQAAGVVRLRVYNVFKGWLESHWRNDCDIPALDLIQQFALDRLSAAIPNAGRRLFELTQKVSNVHGSLVPRLISSIGKTNTALAQYVAPDTPLPAPIITKSQLTALKNWKATGASLSILDFDPLELARQFTLKESRIFCSILPEELLATEWTKKSGSMAVNVRAMSTLSTDLTNLVADCVLQLEDPTKRAKLIKRWVKIAKKCLELNNYDSLMAILCGLTSSTISRLKRTWEVVPAKTRADLEGLNAIVASSRNYASLRQRLQSQVPPCLPFVGTYLTDLTFVDVGNQTTRQLPGEGNGESISVINFDKHVKTARIISELQRFQIPYRLTEVPELQTWMQDQLVRVRSSDESNLQTYYRRSLLLEPRQLPVEVHTPNPSSKEKFDLFARAWPHLSKEKVAIAPSQ
ncbi:hypothetical protein MMC20_005521 [Loxospora ochrophaea]|nr:hypothetical protein [Loxospora ochrophaea]